MPLKLKQVERKRERLRQANQSKKTTSPNKEFITINLGRMAVNCDKIKIL